MLKQKRVAVVGLGVMGRALVSGLTKSGKVPPERIFAAGRSKSSPGALTAEFSVKGFSYQLAIRRLPPVGEDTHPRRVRDVYPGLRGKRVPLILKASW